MVLHKTLHLARNTFTKSLAHGYAQSVVAATQTSYAANTNSFTLPRYNSQNHGRHHHTVQAGSSQSAGNKDSHESGLAAYYTAWQKSQKFSDREWAQFQFPKLLEWSQSPSAEQQTQTGYIEVAPEDEAKARPSLLRSQSTSAVETLRAELEQDNAAESASKISAADVAAEQASEVQAALETETDNALARIDSGINSEKNSSPATLTSEQRASLESEFFVQELESLVLSQQYAAIPAVFESMLARGITPLPAAYDSLLIAAVRLPSTRAQSVEKALSVYNDILARGVQPSAVAYTILIDLLSKRAIEAVGVANGHKEQQLRFAALYPEGSNLTSTEPVDASQEVSMSKALTFFDAARSAQPHHIFDERTYSLLISACAEQAKYGAMARVYSAMSTSAIVPRPDAYISMIHAFAKNSDMASATQVYNDYKGFAISHNDGTLAMIRRDDDIHAAVIRAFTIMQLPSMASDFLLKLEATLEAGDLATLRNVIALKAFIPEWLKQGHYLKALEVANQTLEGTARDVALSAICIRTADMDCADIAMDSFTSLRPQVQKTLPAIALGAMHLRQNDLNAADGCWSVIEPMGFAEDVIAFGTAHAVTGIRQGQAAQGLYRARSAFSSLRRDAAADSTSIGKACRTIVKAAAQSTGAVDAGSMSHLIRLASEHLADDIQSIAGVLSCLHPAQLRQFDAEDLTILASMQAKLILSDVPTGAADASRFSHLVQTLMVANADLEKSLEQLIANVAGKLEMPGVAVQLQQRRYHREQMRLQSVFTPPPSRKPSSFVQRQMEDAADPYAATTDVNGSSAIVQLLETSQGSAGNMSKAFSILKQMHQAGRHPRFFTYSKLISGAAKCNRLDVAHEILAMARHDVPYTTSSQTAHQGWISILDTMISACLTTGQRGLADGFHAELLQMGAAPSANTFGQYITTLKESSTKTVDEASEAVSIFQRACAEGVEPTSFLYNVLIGKLGKARRIDDCLFYYREMRGLGINPTSVTYGTIINALCRVSDQSLAEQLFQEMESMPNYKPRPAPYHSIMQYFLNTKRDRTKVLQYYQRMKDTNIEHTPYTYKLLIDTYATLEPVDMRSAEQLLEEMKMRGFHPEPLHYSALIHAKGCVMKDIHGAQAMFNSVISSAAGNRARLQPCLFQALFESMVATDNMTLAEPVILQMEAHNVEMTPYIANALIQGFSAAKNITKAEVYFQRVAKAKREPSLYEAMTRAYLVNGCPEKALHVVQEASTRGYPAAVQHKISDLLMGEMRMQPAMM